MTAKNKERNKRTLRISIVSVFFLIIGMIMLNYVSALESPPLGIVFNIVVGCIFISVSLIILFVVLKTHFFSKKKKSRSRPIFLDEELIKKRKKT